MSKVLIATLGTMPGAVTSSVDVLLKHQRGSGHDFVLDKVVALTTPNKTYSRERHVPAVNASSLSAEATRAGQGILADEFRRALYTDDTNGTQYNWYQHNFGLQPTYVGYAVNIAADDLYQPEHAFDFLRLCLREIRDHQKPGYEVYVALTGGRKTMSAMALLAATLTGCGPRCFQAAINNDEIETERHQTYTDPAPQSRRKRLEWLHPEAWYLPAWPGTASELLPAVSDDLVNRLINYDPKDPSPEVEVMRTALSSETVGDIE